MEFLAKLSRWLVRLDRSFQPSLYQCTGFAILIAAVVIVAFLQECIPDGLSLFRLLVWYGGYVMVILVAGRWAMHFILKGGVMAEAKRKAVRGKDSIS